MGDRRCCCTNCILVDDRFGSDSIGSYTQIAGIWQVAGGYLETESTDALIARSIPGLPANYIVEADLQAEFYNDEVGLVLYYIDSTHYIYASLRVASVADYCGLLSVVYVNGESETTLFELYLTGIQTEQFHTIQACVLENTSYNYFRQVIIELQLTLSNGRVFEHRIYASVEDPSVGVGLLTKVNNGTAKFDNLLVQTHYLSDPTCPQCHEVCLITSYGFTASKISCEWTGDGTSDGTNLEISGTGSARCLVPSDDDTGTIVHATVSADTAGQKVRVHASNDESLSGPYGELDFTTSYTAIRVVNGSDYAEKFIALSTGTSYNVKLCVEEDGNVTFSLGTNCVIVGGAGLAGPYAGLSNVGPGVLTCSAFSYSRTMANDTICEECECTTLCHWCGDNEGPGTFLVTITGVERSRPYDGPTRLCLPGNGETADEINGSYYVDFFIVETTPIYKCVYHYGYAHPDFGQLGIVVNIQTLGAPAGHIRVFVYITHDLRHDVAGPTPESYYVDIPYDEEHVIDCLNIDVESLTHIPRASPEVTTGWCFENAVIGLQSVH